VAERCGVKRIVSLGALLAGAPHTRPVRVTGRATDPAARSLLEAWGIYRRPTTNPTGIHDRPGWTRRRIGARTSASWKAPHYLRDSEPAGDQGPGSYVSSPFTWPRHVRFPAASGVPHAVIGRWPRTARPPHVRSWSRSDAAANEGRSLPRRRLDSDKLMQDGTSSASSAKADRRPIARLPQQPGATSIRPACCLQIAWRSCSGASARRQISSRSTA
jgi:hypothetical protein